MDALTDLGAFCDRVVDPPDNWGPVYVRMRCGRTKKVALVEVSKIPCQGEDPGALLATLEGHWRSLDSEHPTYVECVTEGTGARVVDRAKRLPPLSADSTPTGETDIHGLTVEMGKMLMQMAQDAGHRAHAANQQTIEAFRELRALDKQIADAGALLTIVDSQQTDGAMEQAMGALTPLLPLVAAKLLKLDARAVLAMGTAQPTAGDVEDAIEVSDVDQRADELVQELRELATAHPHLLQKFAASMA